MKTYLEGLTDKEVLEWYNAQIKSRIKKSKNYQSVVVGKQSLLNHDYFNIYAYGDFIRVVYINSSPNIKRSDIYPFENNGEESGLSSGGTPAKEESLLADYKRLSQSLSRTKSKIFELAMCNEFDFFCTFTQDQTKRNRFDLTEFRKDFAQFVRNQNRGRKDKIKYLLIPEQHKDGAWHMHGLLQGLTEKDLREFSLSENIPRKIKESIKNGEKVYNWEKYSRKFGYFTCTAIRDKGACSRYVTKYITKDLKKTALERGDHLYFASQGLKKREVIVKNCIDRPPFDEWDFENKFVKIKEFTL